MVLLQQQIDRLQASTKIFLITGISVLSALEQFSGERFFVSLMGACPFAREMEGGEQPGPTQAVS
jgi:hypothetical protein